MNLEWKEYCFSIVNIVEIIIKQKNHSLAMSLLDLSIAVEYNAASSSHRLRVMFDNVTAFSINVNHIRKILRRIHMQVNHYLFQKYYILHQ